MENTWNHKQWSLDFTQASKNKAGFHELRSDVFKNNIQIIEQGHYFVEGEKIAIRKCYIADSMLYDKQLQLLDIPTNQVRTKISVTKADCLEVAELLLKTGFSPAVLNMASRRNPGGGVFEGSGAQEENLFRRTNLYTSLFQYVDYGVRYDVPRNSHFSYPLDKNYGAIYTPDITVFRGAEHAGYKLLQTQFQIAVLSVSAISKPDLIEKGGQLRLHENFIEPTKEKIRIMLRLAIEAGHDSLVLSAFGCGAYRNPPEHIAELFHTVFQETEFKGQLKMIVFAIIEDHNSRHPHNPNGNFLPFFEQCRDTSFLKASISGSSNPMKFNKVTDALLGVATGDAVGVPFEFLSREEMQDSPAKNMIGHGTHDQKKGTWSDDSSLTFCLAESLSNGYDLKDISEKFIAWRDAAYWSARGEIFDIGRTTNIAISRLKKLIEEDDLGELGAQKFYGNEYDNGNGSLMRIIPLLFHIKGKDIAEQFGIIWEISALTHRHVRAAMSCLIYLKLAEKLLDETDKLVAYTEMRKEISAFWEQISFAEAERAHFEKIIQNDIRETKIDDLKSGGYVIEVLESSIWFFLKKSTYEDTILSIINIGHDTDTSAAITGGLAGIYYGTAGIPEDWITSLARMEDIIDLGERLNIQYEM